MTSQWQAKYEILREKCLVAEKHNMRLINRIYHIKGMMKTAQKERKAIMKRLDRHNDNFRTFDSFFDADVLRDPSFVKPTKAALMVNKKIKKKKINLVSLSERGEKQLAGGPKKPVNAYFIYCQRTRNEILSQQPEISHQDLTKLLAKRWNEMNQEKKQMYYQLYEQDKERYETELEEFTDGKFKRTKPKAQRKGGPDMAQPSSIYVSPSLDSLADAACLAQIPSPTLTHDETPFAISHIPSPSFH